MTQSKKSFHSPLGMIYDFLRSHFPEVLYYTGRLLLSVGMAVVGEGAHADPHPARF